MFDSFIPYKYAYLFGSIIVLIVWILIFLKRRDLRSQMITLSCITALLAPTEILYVGHYWKPEFLIYIFNLNFGIEDFIVCFSYGGICGVIYEFVTKRTPIQLKNVQFQISKIEFLISILFGFITLIGLEALSNLNIIYTTSASMFVIGVCFVYFRRDLLISGLIAALISSVLCVLVYWIIIIFIKDFFDLFWITNEITNIRLLGIPVEEYFFHFSLGLCLGIMYEVANGLYDGKLPKLNKKGKIHDNKK
ncbi:MAG: lycopene cyclase domain-containing protein [bacterium]